jgi:hypothetical protein
MSYDHGIKFQTVRDLFCEAQAPSHNPFCHAILPSDGTILLMSPPSGHKYNDMYWDDMPEAAHKAAQTLGYTKEIWDADESVPYQDQGFAKCSAAEKQAAMFLNMSPIAAKLNVWWEDLDATTQKHATTLGWTNELWDQDYEIEDLEIEHQYWSDLNAPQQEAAAYFGYTKATWDETWNAEDMAGGAPPAAGKPSSGAGKMFTPPPKGKVFKKDNGKKDEDHGEKKEEEHHRLKPERLIKPFKKFFGKQDGDDK